MSEEPSALLILTEKVIELDGEVERLRESLENIMLYMKTKGDPDDYFALVNIVEGDDE